jgi:hypothetical protein
MIKSLKAHIRYDHSVVTQGWVFLTALHRGGAALIRRVNQLNML